MWAYKRECPRQESDSREAPKALQERNYVGLLYTKKIRVVFFGLAARLGS